MMMMMMMMMKLYRILAFVLLLFLVGCGGTETSVEVSNNDDGISATDMGKMSSSDYNSMSPENKYRVSNKLLSTLFKGVTVSSFFDLSSGLLPLILKEGEGYIDKTEAMLSKPLTDKSTYLDRVDDKYNFDSAWKPKQYPLAMLFELPLSKDYYDHWMAYILTNTILFSPAVELETTDYVDIQKVYYRLTYMIDEDRSISDTVLSSLE